MKRCFLALCVATFLPSSALAESRYDFELYNLSDKLVRTASLRQRCKLVLVDFFSLYCRPCRKSLPKLARWQKKYAAGGLCAVVVAEPGPAEDKSAALAKTITLFRRQKPRLTVVWDKYALVAKRYGVSKKGSLDLPQLFLLDARGKLVKKARDARAMGKVITARIR